MDPDGAPTVCVLLARARDGDAEAFAALYTRYLPAARNVARHWDARHDADDVVQDVMAQIWSLLQRGAGPRENFGAYVMTAVRHACGRRAAVASRTRPVNDEDLVDLRHDDVFAGEERDDFLRSFRRLSIDHRDLLWRMHVEGWSVRELASSSDSTPNAVSAMACRARRAVRSGMVVRT